MLYSVCYTRAIQPSAAPPAYCFTQSCPKLWAELRSVAVPWSGPWFGLRPRCIARSWFHLVWFWFLIYTLAQNLSRCASVRPIRLSCPNICWHSSVRLSVSLIWRMVSSHAWMFVWYIIIIFRFTYIIGSPSCSLCSKCYTRMLYATLRSAMYCQL
jgi:hypothetical protein